MRPSLALLPALAVLVPLAALAAPAPALPVSSSAKLVAILRAQTAPPAAKTSAAYALPEGPGKEPSERVCSACHAPNVFTHQRHDEAGWSKIINQMIAKGADGSDEDFAKILSYLVTNFGPDSPAAPAPAPPSAPTPAAAPPSAPPSLR